MSVLHTTEDGIATITLNRPNALNAGNQALLSGLLGALAQAADDESVRSVLLTGAGQGFCAGADLAALAWWPEGMTVGEGVVWILEEYWNRIVITLAEYPKPTVAAVNGVAAGGGVGLALACDVVIAAESADFVQVFGPQLAIVPDVGSTWHLPRLVGPARARGLALLGDRLDATTAKEWGLIWDTAPDAELLETARVVARRLGALDPDAMTSIRAILRDSHQRGLPDQLAAEAQANGRLAMGPGMAEGITAFLEKRPRTF